MTIHKLFGNRGAEEARGVVVVIDIVRAATVEACALAKGAVYIIPVATKEEAFALKKLHPDYLLAGEENGYKIKGFDFGNSPSEIMASSIKDKVLVHRTSAGTQGLVQATQADQLIFGSFVTSLAIVKNIEKNQPQTVSLVITEGEDEIFADYLIAQLQQKSIDWDVLKKRFYKDPGVEWFLGEERSQFPLEDLEIALEKDKFDFFCEVKKEGKNLVTRKKEILR